MRYYLSVCSGIEAATCAWHSLGWTPAAFSEIEPFPSEVLKYHYPHVPNLGDMTKFEEWNLGTIDLLVGGTPCQSFSVAGLRKGLDDPRGNLMLTYLAIARKHRPRWLVWENVPGVLSSNGGEDFATLLRGLVELGYGWAYRVLDAQYIRTHEFPRAVPQRRRRVFVVGYLGDWHRAAAVLFERSSLSGNPEPSRTKRKDTASGAQDSVRTGNRLQAFGQYINDETASAMKSRDFKDATDLITEPMVIHGTQDPITSNVAFPLATNQGQENAVIQGVYEMHGQDSRVRDLGDVCSTVTQKYGTGGGNVPIALSAQAVDVYNQVVNGDVAATLTEACGGTNTSGPKVIEPILGGWDYENNAHGSGDATGPLLKGSPSGGGRPLPAVALASMAVRRLTPMECERLQGFKDGYTAIPWKGKDTPDGLRYRALGNSMAVNVMAWLGERIMAVDELPKQEAS